MFSLCCHTVSSSWYACLCFLIEYAAEIMSQLYADRAFCCAFNFRTTGIWCLFMYEYTLFIYSTFHVCWLECLHTLSDRLNAITAFRVWKLWMLVTIWQVVSVCTYLFIQDIEKFVWMLSAHAATSRAYEQSVSEISGHHYCLFLLPPLRCLQVPIHHILPCPLTTSPHLTCECLFLGHLSRISAPLIWSGHNTVCQRAEYYLISLINYFS